MNPTMRRRLTSRFETPETVRAERASATQTLPRVTAYAIGSSWNGVCA
jgi:hypothetical protein